MFDRFNDLVEANQKRAHEHRMRKRESRDKNLRNAALVAAALAIAASKMRNKTTIEFKDPS